MHNCKCLYLYIALLLITWEKAGASQQTSKPLVVFKDFEQDCNACLDLVTPILHEERLHRFKELQQKLKDLAADIAAKDQQLNAQHMQLNACEQAAVAKESLAQNHLQHKASQLEELQKRLGAKEQELQQAEIQLQALQQKLGFCEQAVANGKVQNAQLQDLHASCVNSSVIKDELIARDQALIKKQSEQKDHRIAELLAQVKAKQQLEQQFNRTRLADLEQFSNLSTQLNQSVGCQGKANDIHVLKVAGSKTSFSVYCESQLAGPGWIVVLRRSNGSTSFDRNWTEYSRGFGNLRGEFFLGLDKLHQLTASQPHELYIYLRDFSKQERYAHYDRFRIADKKLAYRLEQLGKYSGTAGDALTSQKSMPFSTPDRDNDESPKNCARQFSSGWWFRSCYFCNLNGPYVRGQKDQYGINWFAWHKGSMQFVAMMIRPT